MGLNYLRTPWKQDWVEKLNWLQRSNKFHPYTCPHSHLDRGLDHTDDTHRILVATQNGFVCETCGYTQEWAFVDSVKLADDLMKEEESNVERQAGQ